MRMILTGALMMALAVGTSGQDKPAGANPVVVIETTMGDITVELDKATAPVSVENFLSYVKDGFYSGTVFHRVIKGFMIQGGGFTADMQRKPGTKAAIQNEATNGLKNARGTIAMARTSEIRSATSQFFINTANNAGLDHKGLTPNDYGYAVFGTVVAGMDVVDKIEGVATGTAGGHQNVPKEPVTIKAVRVKS